MTAPLWQLQSPVSAVIFDCDGTLSTIEGIDELAQKKGVGDIVQSLTAEAMGKTGLNPELYQKRLDLVQPCYSDVVEMGELYATHQVEDVDHVIRIFQRLQKSVYIVSAGLYPAVAIFGERLHIPRKNIFAVDVKFDAAGNYLQHESDSPMTHNSGKRIIVSEIKKNHPTLAYTGDGLNDLSTYDIVTRFIGYGGSYYRANIAERCQYYIRSASLSPLLPLVLTAEEVLLLTADESQLYQIGLQTILEGQVKCE